MKILLIYPPFLDKKEYRRYLEKSQSEPYTLPLGLAYIASFMKKAGYNDIDLLDAYAKKMNFEQISEYIRKTNPQVIGISCLSDERAITFKLVKLIKSISEKIKIVLGGPHPTLMYEQILMNFPVDVVVIGEGEYTFLELIKAWESRRSLLEVKGIAYRENDNIIETKPRERIKNLDELPFPAYELVNLNNYKLLSFAEEVCKIKGLSKIPNFAAISSSRGCVGKCNFCSTPGIWKRKWTARSAENIVDEIEMLNKKYNITFFIFTDDIFSVNQKRVIDLSEKILDRKLEIMWGFETSVRFVSLEMLEKAKLAGCSCIFYGIESGSKTILKNITKENRNSMVVKAFELTKKAGILTGAFLMVGNVGENRKSIYETIQLLRVIRPDIIAPQIAMVAPGTGLYKIAKSQNFIDESYWLSDYTFPYYTYEHNLRKLLRWHRKIQNYRKNNISILLHSIRDAVEFNAGIRITKKGVSRVPPAPLKCFV